MIAAVTGGRNHHPSGAELAALWRALAHYGVRVLRVGCARGVDRVVLESARAMPMGHGPGSRLFSVERWEADWTNHGNGAGHRRNGAMLELSLIHI